MGLPACGASLGNDPLLPTLAVFFSFDPFADIGGTILELGPIRFATRQKPNGISIHKRYVPQIQNRVVSGCFQSQELSQLAHVFQFDSTAQGEDDFSVG
jgi:hypothetical protein